MRKYEANVVPRQEALMVNIGSFDRLLRFALGALLLLATVLPPGAPLLGGLGLWTWVLAAAGIVLLGTAALRICPAYWLFGIRTCAATKA
jgi:hypothetical protein